MRDANEIKIIMANFDYNNGTKLCDLVETYLKYWRGLLFENKISSYMDYRDMSDKLYISLGQHVWNGDEKKLNQLASEIERKYRKL